MSGALLGHGVKGFLRMIGIQVALPTEQPADKPMRHRRPRGGVNAAAHARRLRMARQSRRINRGGRHGGFA